MRTAACGLYDLFPGMTAFLQGWMNTTPKTLPGGKKGQDKGVLTMKKTKIIVLWVRQRTEKRSLSR